MELETQYEWDWDKSNEDTDTDAYHSARFKAKQCVLRHLILWHQQKTLQEEIDWLERRNEFLKREKRTRGARIETETETGVDEMFSNHVWIAQARREMRDLIQVVESICACARATRVQT
jgi:hypothetical protein